MPSTRDQVQQALYQLDKGWGHPAWDYPTDKIHKLFKAVMAHPAILDSTCGDCEEIQNAIDDLATDLLQFSFNEENYVDDNEYPETWDECTTIVHQETKG